MPDEQPQDSAESMFDDDDMISESDGKFGRLAITRVAGSQSSLKSAFFIGDHIRVEVVSVDSAGRVRLCIQAPRSMSVDRAEVRKRKNAERRRLTNGD
jgi:carbon storage regulator CsrA